MKQEKREHILNSPKKLDIKYEGMKIALTRLSCRLNLRTDIKNTTKLAHYNNLEYAHQLCFFTHHNYYQIRYHRLLNLMNEY